MKRLRTTDKNFEKQLNELLSRDTAQSADINSRVEKILGEIKLKGDQALLNYTSQLDNLTVERVDELEIKQSELCQAVDQIDPELRNSLQFAAKRIENYHRHQLSSDWTFTDEYGAELGQRVTALDKVGIYVPGGKAAYPSSVLMAAIPAKLAGVKQLIMSVPTPGNSISKTVLAAAAMAGVDRVFKIGGAQAIASMAYGTQTIPRVDKIVGPGNAYVAAAKRMVFGDVGIDMIAGPSEVLVVSDSSVNPQWVAMDMFAQAEHDEMAQSIHITTDEKHHHDVNTAIRNSLSQQPRKTIIEQALNQHGALIVAENNQQVANLINRIAPEHLELMTKDPDSLLDKVRHAGSIFLGRYSAEALGDYCAGPNHVLPTSGTARFSSPLGVYDFQKRSSVVRFTEHSVTDVANAAALLANAEGLRAHEYSARLRSNKCHE